VKPASSSDDDEADCGGAGARPGALLLHQPREARLVDRDAVLGAISAVSSNGKP
jgi:hypothetical protein